MHFLKRVVCLSLLLTMGNSLLAPAALAFTPSQQLIGSIVKIYGQVYDPETDTYEDTVFGSGFFVENTNDRIVTNGHVVLTDSYEPFDRYVICQSFSAADTPKCLYTAEVEIADYDNDLALLRLNRTNPEGETVPLPTVTPPHFGNSDNLQLGGEINVLGYPDVGKETITQTKGSISGFLSENINGTPTKVWIKSDAKINPGNSGGAAFDADGNLIGIPTQVEFGFDALGYIRPSNFISAWIKNANNLIRNSTELPIVEKEIPSSLDDVFTEAGDREITLSWPESYSTAGIKHYEITYDTKSFDPNRWTKPVSELPHYQTTGETSLTITGLENGTTYYFYVRAVSENNKPAEYWSYEASDTPTDEVLSDEVFLDVPNTHEAYLALTYLKNNEVISGYPDGTFRPGETINRAELMKIVVTGQGIRPDPVKYRNCFPDVMETWYSPYVCYGLEKGWIQGYPDGMFKPSDTANKAEVIKILLNAYDAPDFSAVQTQFGDIHPEQWFYRFVSTAEQMQLLPERDNFEPGQAAKRGITAEYLYRLNLIKKNEMLPAASPTWQTPSGEEVTVSDFLAVQDGKEWDFVSDQNLNDNGNTAPDNIITATECETESECFDLRYDDHYTSQIFPEDPEVLIKKLTLHEGTGNDKEVAYEEPETLFSTRNRINYFRLAEGTPVRADDGSTITLYDGTNSLEFDGFETVETPATGQVSALKVKITDLVHINTTKPMYENDISHEAFVLSTGTRYYASGVGLIKSETRTTLLYNGQTYELSAGTNVLKSYKN